MANYFEFKPVLTEIARYLRLIATKDCCSSTSVSSGTEATVNPLTLSSGFTTLSIKKVGATGTVEVTFPDSSVYVLSADGEEFVLNSKSPLGEFTIEALTGATYKYYTV